MSGGCGEGGEALAGLRDAGDGGYEGLYPVAQGHHGAEGCDGTNFWDDITIPYWSMPENTDHPTQKPEKLIAKLILASSTKDAMVFDPFLGSGTTAVVAKKLGRKYCGIEMNEEYCLWALKRMALAENDDTIQGYTDGVFWERNTLSFKNGQKEKIIKGNYREPQLFEHSNGKLKQTI